MTRACRKCGVVKALEEFHAHKQCREGRVSTCKACVAEYHKSPERKAIRAKWFPGWLKTPKGREWLKRNAAAMKARGTTKEQRQRRYQRNKVNPKYQERHRQYMKTYLPKYQRAWRPKHYAANPEALERKQRQQRESYKRKMADPVRKAKLMAYMTIAVERRRARLRGVECRFTRDDWAGILARQENRCAYCVRSFSEELKPTMDHVIPLVRGGGHTPENIVAACRPCNSSKHVRPWTPKLVAAV